MKQLITATLFSLAFSCCSAPAATQSEHASTIPAPSTPDALVTGYVKATLAGGKAAQENLLSQAKQLDAAAYVTFLQSIEHSLQEGITQREERKKALTKNAGTKTAARSAMGIFGVGLLIRGTVRAVQIDRAERRVEQSTFAWLPDFMQRTIREDETPLRDLKEQAGRVADDAKPDLLRFFYSKEAESDLLKESGSSQIDEEKSNRIIGRLRSQHYEDAYNKVYQTAFQDAFKNINVSHKASRLQHGLAVGWLDRIVEPITARLAAVGGAGLVLVAVGSTVHEALLRARLERELQRARSTLASIKQALTDKQATPSMPQSALAGEQQLLDASAHTTASITEEKKLASRDTQPANKPSTTKTAVIKKHVASKGIKSTSRARNTTRMPKKVT